MRRLFRPLVLIALVALTASCHDQACQGHSPVYLVVDSILVANGGSTTPTFVGAPLLSDVQTKGSVFNDLGQVTLHVALKDLGPGQTALTPSTNNQVTITRYHVDFVRADGKNTPGVDVPYGFDGTMTGTVPPSGTVNIAFELVRHDAKLEPPLVQLVSNLVVINTIANITFYGQDLAGNPITVKGSVSVDFANFADPS